MRISVLLINNRILVVSFVRSYCPSGPWGCISVIQEFSAASTERTEWLNALNRNTEFANSQLLLKIAPLNKSISTCGKSRGGVTDGWTAGQSWTELDRAGQSWTELDRCEKGLAIATEDSMNWMATNNTLQLHTNTKRWTKYVDLIVIKLRSSVGKSRSCHWPAWD